MSPPDPRWAFSLGRGAPGILLAHAARAHTGQESWQAAHAWAQTMVAAPVPATEHSGLFEGAPAVAFALHTVGHAAYAPALETVDRATVGLTEQRLDAAHARLDSGALPTLREFDLISGLTGLGIYLLSVHSSSALLRDVLTYLVRLTLTITTVEGDKPGWWTPNAPADRPDPGFPRGHANLGVAHGVGGPLGLLATASLSGIEVPGGREAVGRILAFYDTWQRDEPAAWWPEWVTDHNHPQRRPGRPSWCYGAAGIAWAHHLAGRALGDGDRQLRAERALLGAATDPQQLGQLTHPGLCHGQAGLRLILDRVAEHAILPQLRAHQCAPLSPTAAPRPGLLDGQAGLDLARTETSTWANCLLLGRTSVRQRPGIADF